MYGFVGENGSGKSTLCDILAGLYNDYTGEIFINGINFKNIDMDQYKEYSLIYIPQKFLPISSDSKENADLFLQNYEYNDFKYYKNLSLLDEKRKDATEGNSNKKLSGGEEKKIGFILALLKRNASLVIFDETFANLDKDIRAIYLDCIAEIKTRSIVIIISHTEELIDFVDEVIHFRRIR